jgi:hypothetical protein
MPKAAMPNTEVVKIKEDGHTEQTEHELSKGRDHRLLWVSESTQDWDIYFKDGRSPFKKNEAVFHVAAGGWAESGEIKGDADEGREKKYQYEPRLAGTKHVAADADVIIQP